MADVHLGQSYEMISRMKRVSQIQLATTLAAVAVVFFVRLTSFPQSSPFELFLLLNIALAVLFRTPATIASIVLGFGGAWTVMLIEGRFPSRTGTNTVIYLVLSGILLLLNHRWHRARDRAERQRTAHAEQRERLLAEAQEANRAKDRLLANVSHELRTPLNAISGWAVMMSRPDATSRDIARAAEVIKRNAETLARTVDQLLDASLASTGRIRIELVPVAVGPTVSAAVESMLPEAAARGLSIYCGVAADIGMIAGDQGRLHQVMLTLLSNAIKFTEPPGQIMVEGKASGGFLVIQVTDTGIGIEPDYLPSVFDGFSQADSSTTRAYGGVGLGLTIARELVEVMGGRITASSQGSGRGTTISVRFPSVGPPQGTPV